jgi:ketosteroid isomerase-like protein
VDRTLTSAEDRLAKLEAIEDVRSLKAAYCHWADRGYSMAGSDDNAFAGLFTDDAVWTGGNGQPAVGRHAIAARAAAFRPFGIHLVTNGQIDVDLEAKTAHARWQVIAPSVSHRGEALWIVGTYDDQMVHISDGWRFQRVTFSAAIRCEYGAGWGDHRPIESEPGAVQGGSQSLN